jgi:hypothetical protein
MKKSSASEGQSASELGRMRQLIKEADPHDGIFRSRESKPAKKA